MRSKITSITALLCLAACWPAASWGQTGSELNAPKPTTPPAAWPAQAVRGAKTMVASDEPLASAAGVEILKKGGNPAAAPPPSRFPPPLLGPRPRHLGAAASLL